MGEKRWNMSDIHERTGISRSSISAFYYDKAKRIDYGTLDRLCEVFGCQPGDLLVQEKGERQDDSE
jgi:putative transcriptional regulator